MNTGLNPAIRFLQQGNFAAASQALQQAQTSEPHNPQVWSLSSQLCARLNDYAGALQHSRRLTELAPDSAQAWHLHANNLNEAGRFDDSLAAFQTAEKNSPHKSAMKLQQAHLLRTLGRNDEAITLYLECTRDASLFGSACWALAGIGRYQFTPAQQASLEAYCEAGDRPAEQACQAGFALARHYEKQQQFDLAMTTYHNANMNKPGVVFSPQAYAAKCTALVDTFQEGLYKVTEEQEKTGVTPIFITGLPRAGSTLIEQILASHSQIEGTMELKSLPAVARKVYLDSCIKNGDRSGTLDKFSAAELAGYGEQYLQLTRIFRQGKPYFIDKLPPNFQHIGLIKLILPQAIIIDARRHPMACGFGTYKQYFAQGHDFSYQLGHIGFYYNQYLKLMQYWDGLFGDDILHMQHEDLITDTEGQVRRLLAHCRLPYEADCLQFFNNPRAVRTASSDQVRQPIHRSGMDAWKQVKDHLTALEAALID